MHKDAQQQVSISLFMMFLLGHPNLNPSFAILLRGGFYIDPRNSCGILTLHASQQCGPMGKMAAMRHDLATGVGNTRNACAASAGARSSATPRR